MAFFIALIISLLAAIVPTLIYAAAFYWADHHEREPKWLVGIAFLWGALPAVAVSLVGEIFFGAALIGEGGTLAASITESAIIAPIIEEIAKGAAIFLIYSLFRHEFDGALDGLIYGALVGFGFAMTENFFYFVGAFDEGGFVSLSILIVLRSLIFGLNHALYTGLTGLGFGLARESPSVMARRFWPIFGLSMAILVHALHNLGASLSEVSGVAILLSLALAVFGILLILVAYFLSLKRERMLIRQELAGEVGTLLSEADYLVLCGQNNGKNRSNFSKDQKRLTHLYAKLAFAKRRLANYGAAGHVKTAQEVDRLRTQIVETAAQVRTDQRRS